MLALLVATGSYVPGLSIGGKNDAAGGGTRHASSVGPRMTQDNAVVSAQLQKLGIAKHGDHWPRT